MDIRKAFGAASNAAAVLSGRTAQRNPSMPPAAEAAIEADRFVDSDGEAAEHFATEADQARAMQAAVHASNKRRKQMPSFLALEGSDDDDGGHDDLPDTDDEAFIDKDSDPDESSRSIPPSGVLLTPPPKRRRLQRGVIEDSSDDDDEITEVAAAASPPATSPSPSPLPRGNAEEEPESPRRSHRSLKKSKSRGPRRRAEEEAAAARDSDDDSTGSLFAFDDDDDDAAALTPSFTIRDYYCGVRNCEARMPDGSMIRFCLKPRTVPFWRKVIRVPGIDSIQYINTTLKKTAGPCAFAVDKDNMLCREVKVPVMQALCGRGLVTTEAPDGTEHTVEIDCPLKQDELLLFADAGFGRDPMIGVVKLEMPPAALSQRKSDKLWKIFQEVDPLHCE